MIYSDIDSKVYIGSSNNLTRRLKRHMSELKHNTHHNIHLQRFVNKYGLDHVKTKVLLTCTEQELVILEIAKIQEYNSFNRNYGYNLAYPDNTKRHFSIEERQQIAEKVKYNKHNYKINVIKDNNTVFCGYICELEEKFNIDKSSVYKILKGTRKKHKGYTFRLAT